MEDDEKLKMLKNKTHFTSYFMILREIFQNHKEILGTFDNGEIKFVTHILNSPDAINKFTTIFGDVLSHFGIDELDIPLANEIMNEIFNSEDEPQGCDCTYCEFNTDFMDELVLQGNKDLRFWLQNFTQIEAVKEKLNNDIIVYDDLASSEEEEFHTTLLQKPENKSIEDYQNYFHRLLDGREEEEIKLSDGKTIRAICAVVVANEFHPKKSFCVFSNIVAEVIRLMAVFVIFMDKTGNVYPTLAQLIPRDDCITLRIDVRKTLINSLKKVIEVTKSLNVPVAMVGLDSDRANPQKDELNVIIVKCLPHAISNLTTRAKHLHKQRKNFYHNNILIDSNKLYHDLQKNKLYPHNSVIDNMIGGMFKSLSACANGNPNYADLKNIHRDFFDELFVMLIDNEKEHQNYMPLVILVEYFKHLRAVAEVLNRRMDDNAERIFRKAIKFFDCIKFEYTSENSKLSDNLVNNFQDSLKIFIGFYKGTNVPIDPQVCSTDLPYCCSFEIKSFALQRNTYAQYYVDYFKPNIDVLGASNFSRNEYTLFAPPNKFQQCDNFFTIDKTAVPKPTEEETLKAVEYKKSCIALSRNDFDLQTIAKAIAMINLSKKKGMVKFDAEPNNPVFRVIRFIILKFNP